MSKLNKQQQKRVDNHVKNVEKYERKQQLQKASKKIRRNTTSKGTRRKDWLGDDFEAVADIDDFERIMPRDEIERRRSVEQLAYKKAAETADDGNRN